MIEAIETGWAVGAYAIAGRGDGAARRERWARSGRKSVSITHDAAEMAEIDEFSADQGGDVALAPAADGTILTATELARMILRSAARAKLTQARLGPGAVRHLVRVNQMNRV